MGLKCLSLYLVASRSVVRVVHYCNMVAIETKWIAILSTINLYLSFL